MPKRTFGQGGQICRVTGAACCDTMLAKRPPWTKKLISAGPRKSYGGSVVVIALVATLAWFIFSGDPARAQNVSRGETIFQRCAACHSVTRGKANGVGPNLHGIVGPPRAGSGRGTGWMRF
jgi:mono/diheme cytochrome c family protein